MTISCHVNLVQEIATSFLGSMIFTSLFWGCFVCYVFFNFKFKSNRNDFLHLEQVSNQVTEQQLPLK